MTLEDPGKAVAQRCHHAGDTAHALFAAVAQIALSLRESQSPIAELGSLFARQSEKLAAARATSATPPAPEPAAPATPAAAPTPHATDPTPHAEAAALRALVEQLQADVFQGIQQMQFYDRLVQHLTHIQDYMVAIANELDTFKTQPQSQQFWDALHAKLRTRLISDEQRGLLDVFTRPDTPHRVSAQATLKDDYSPPGDFEMF